MFIVFLLSFVNYSQNTSVIDSLKHIVEVSDNDSLIMNAYNKLRRATYYSDAEASKNYTYKYLEYAQKRKDSHNIILAHFFIGNASVLSGEYETALNKYLIAVAYYEQKKDSARFTSVLNSLGAVHEKTNNDSLSLYYYKQARSIGKALKDNRRSGIASANIGNIYNNRGSLDDAIFYLEDAVKDLSSNDAHKSFLTIAEINLAGAYSENQKFSKSLDLFNKVLVKLDTINDVYNHANVLRGISNVYLEQKEPFKALPFAKKAFKKYTDNNFNDERFQMMPELIEIFKATKKSTEAVTLYDEYFIVKDSILSSEQDKNIANAIQKYETEKKDTQLKVLALESEKAEQQKRVFLYLFLIGLFVTALIGFFLYKNRKKNKLLAKQKSLLESTVDEKNILLRETHHRVKNSFQMVSSLLYIQSETVQNKEAQLAIKEAQNRVRSMVLIHQKLYSKDQLVGIDAKEYIEDFTKDIMDSYQFETIKLKYTVSAESLVLDIETITPIGLILNELVTNVLKHAFNNITNESYMNITLKEVDNELILSVIDNGIGMPESIKEESFGIELIKALTQKLKATLNIKPNEPSGTNATVIMKRYTIL